MNIVNPRTAHVLKNPVAFTLQVLKAFQANQGLRFECHASRDLTFLAFVFCRVGSFS